MDWDIVVVIVTMPLNVVLWAVLTSVPLRLFFNGKPLAIASLIGSMIILASIIFFKPDLAMGVRIAGGIAAPCAAMLCYFWWLGRQQRERERA